MRRTLAILLGLSVLVGCEEAQPPVEPLPNGLLIALAVLATDDAGNPVPQPAQAGILTRGQSGWSYQTIEDPDSNVFHKAMVYASEPGSPAILTLGGTRAILKLWRRGSEPELVW